MPSISNDQWKKKLTYAQYAVLRQKNTEPPYSGELLYNEEDGVYFCAACDQELFSSQHKFYSGSGWPSFYNVADNKAVLLKQDNSKGLKRIEITCSKCGSHIGHVFNDAPDQPTGLRFCVNSVALNFKSDTKE